MSDRAIPREKIQRRLRRIEGQVRGIQKMLEEERDCESILTQLVAVRSAIDGVGALVLKNYMTVCFPGQVHSMSKEIDSLARAVGIWGGVRVGDGA